MISVVKRLRGGERSVWSGFARAGLAVIVAGAGVLGAAAPEARADVPPVLTANPNPVKVLTTKGSGQTTIHWDTGSGKKGKVTLQEKTGNIVGQENDFDQADNGKGDKQATIAYGTTYTFRLYVRQDGAWKFLKLLAVKAQLVKLQLDLGCAMQCITETAVEPHGTFAAFDVKTNEPAKLMIQVGTSSALDSDGTLANVHSMAVHNTSYKTSFSLNVGPSLLGLALEPNTTYYYVVIAKDAGGNTATSSPKSFKTLKRSVKVTFQEIGVTDDSDDLSDGDLGFFFWVDGNKMTWPSSDPGDDWAGTGDKLHPNVSKTIVNAPDSIKIEVKGYDDDDDPDLIVTLDTCGSGIPPGIGCDNEQAYGSTTVNVAVDGVGEAFSSTFSFNASGSDDLKFSVKGTFQVSYAP